MCEACFGREMGRRNPARVGVKNGSRRLASRNKKVIEFLNEPIWTFHCGNEHYLRQRFYLCSTIRPEKFDSLYFNCALMLNSSILSTTLFKSKYIRKFEFRTICIIKNFRNILKFEMFEYVFKPP